MRTVNVKGESTVNSGRCKMERTSPWPRTVTVLSCVPRLATEHAELLLEALLALFFSELAILTQMGRCCGGSGACGGGR